MLFLVCIQAMIVSLHLRDFFSHFKSWVRVYSVGVCGILALCYSGFQPWARHQVDDRIHIAMFTHFGDAWRSASSGSYEFIDRSQRIIWIRCSFRKCHRLVNRTCSGQGSGRISPPAAWRTRRKPDTGQIFVRAAVSLMESEIVTMLRVISSGIRLLFCVAVAISVLMSEMRVTDSRLIDSSRLPAFCACSTALLLSLRAGIHDCDDVARMDCFFTLWISIVELCVRAARVRHFISNHRVRPCSPARAASIAAFRANRLVCSAMLRMTSRILLILLLLNFQLMGDSHRTGHFVGQDADFSDGFPTTLQLLRLPSGLDRARKRCALGSAGNFA